MLVYISIHGLLVFEKNGEAYPNEDVEKTKCTVYLIVEILRNVTKHDTIHVHFNYV
jgi:hypothetical protein